MFKPYSNRSPLSFSNRRGFSTHFAYPPRRRRSFSDFRSSRLFNDRGFDQDLFDRYPHYPRSNFARDLFSSQCSHHHNDHSHSHDHHSHGGSPFNSRSRDDRLDSNRRGWSRPSPFDINRNERYIYPPEDMHIRIPVLAISEHDGGREKFTAIIPMWATIDDIYFNLSSVTGRGRRGKGMDILVLGMNGEMLPLEASRDVRDLETGVEGLVVIEGGRCL